MLLNVNTKPRLALLEWTIATVTEMKGFAR